MLPIIIVLAVVTVFVIIAEDWRKFRNKPSEKAKRQKRKEAALLKGSRSISTERLQGKQA